MKITKILAMLLALCMLVCCFAACDKKDEEKKDDETKVEETKAEEPKAEGIVGDWEGKADFGKIVAEMGDMDIDAELDLTYVFEFEDDGKYALSVKLPSDSKVEKFVEDILEFSIDQMIEQYGVASEDELAEKAGYSSYDEFYAEFKESYTETVVGLLEGMEQGESGKYVYDNGELVLDEGTDNEIKFEIDFDGDKFVVESTSDENAELVMGGVEFERQ